MSPKKDLSGINEKTKYEFLQELGITPSSKKESKTKTKKENK